MNSESVTLPRNTNQAHGLGQFALDFLAGRLGTPSDAVFQQVERFHRDSMACGVSALAARANAPTLLRAEAMRYGCPPGDGSACFGSIAPVHPEKAVAANCSAVREWDSNGTNFGYNPARGHTRGEFGHNDFYPVAVAAAQLSRADGNRTLCAMILLDEIRGRLAEVYSLKDHKIDHVVHGAIASAVVFAAMSGATAEQIESAIGLVVAHYIPFRAIRHGRQLSDSKGASAALSAEVAVLSARRAMRGFVGPADIFRNSEAIFSLFEPPHQSDCSPFDLTLSCAGDDFALMGMHFKLGLYEHQSAGAIQGLIDLLAAYPALMADPDQLRAIEVTIYEPAFHIIADPAKRNPTTRQSADHSLFYIIATLLRKAIGQKRSGWRELMLLPDDYGDEALRHPQTRRFIERMELRHGGSSFDEKYPDGIPTTLAIDHATLGHLSSGLVMYPEGHARAKTGQLDSLLDHKFQALAAPAVSDVAALERRFTNLGDRSPEEIAALYDFEIRGCQAQP
ncbi:MAG TPA: MmgE/PrpD family protein [Pirellulales bacterium]|nr:MmgE/PrpD family protein [Pirellulales bacterium]